MPRVIKAGAGVGSIGGRLKEVVREGVSWTPKKRAVHGRNVRRGWSSSRPVLSFRAMATTLDVLDQVFDRAPFQLFTGLDAIVFGRDIIAYRLKL